MYLQQTPILIRGLMDSGRRLGQASLFLWKMLMLLNGERPPGAGPFEDSDAELKNRSNWI